MYVNPVAADTVTGFEFFATVTSKYAEACLYDDVAALVTQILVVPGLLPFTLIVVPFISTGVTVFTKLVSEELANTEVSIDATLGSSDAAVIVPPLLWRTHRTQY